MGQGLLGVVRNIAGSLEHDPTMQTLKHTLHEAGIIGSAADRTALGAIHRELAVEAIAAGFRDSFLLLSLFFIIGCLPLLYITVRWLSERKRSSTLKIDALQTQ